MEFHSGQTRMVMLLGRWALKIPHLSNGWKFFLLGMLANENERLWSGYDERLCPVLWCTPFGLLLCMRRAEPWMSDEPPEMPGLPFLDLQPTNFGTLNGKAVSIDYGETIESIRCPDCQRWWDECEEFKDVT